LEFPRNPYIPVAREALPRSPGQRFESEGIVTVQVNVDANGLNIVGDAANEPSIAVDPTNPNKMAICWRQFDTIQSDFRQAGWAYTTDGGAHWTFPGVVEPGVFRSDPVVDSDADGKFYFNSLTNVGGYQCKVFKSIDGGQTWGPGVFAQGGDKQWQVIDTTGGIGRGNIYACWNRSYSICNGHFTRSINGAQSFEACTNVPGNPYWGTLAVGPDGELYVCGNGFVVAKSTTAQNPAVTPVQFDFSVTVNLGGSLAYGMGPNPDGLLGQACMDVDHSSGPTRGYVYLLASVDPSGADPLDLMFSRSIDGGHSWSAPVRVNDDPAGSNAWQWFGTLSVAPNGRIDVVWLDTRNDPGGYDSQLYYAYSEDAGQTWSENQVLSPAFDPHIGWPQQNKMGDYFDMTSDNQGVRLAWAGTFNGEEDVYYTYITRLLSISLPDGAPDLLMPHQPTDITVKINPGQENYIPGSGMLHYRYDGGAYHTVPLDPLGDQLYKATLPPAGCSDVPEFYFSAQGDQSGAVYLPPNAPAAVFSARVGEIIVVLYDNFETDQGWTPENLGATSGNWERGVPVNDPNWAYDPISDSDGSGQCWLTENALGNTDVDNGAVRLNSPRFDFTAGDITLAYDYYLYLTDTNGADRFLVEINSSDGVGSWIEIARHTTSGGTSWRHREITEAELTALGVVLTDTMRLRITVNDADPQSIVESGLDAFSIKAFRCADIHIGDLNCDGAVDFKDINPFVLYLSNFAAWQAAYPDCPPENGDINQDGDYPSFKDINPFVALLSNP
jgi:hypothetical protein